MEVAAGGVSIADSRLVNGSLADLHDEPLSLSWSVARQVAATDFKPSLRSCPRCLLGNARVFEHDILQEQKSQYDPGSSHGHRSVSLALADWSRRAGSVKSAELGQ